MDYFITQQGVAMYLTKRPKAQALLASLTGKALEFDCNVTTHDIVHKAGVWQQIRIEDTYPGLNNGVFLLTAGIHGTEIAGPLTIQQRFADITASTRVAGLKLVCYPLMNPSGFDNRTDRNIDGDGGDAGNNDFLRYQKFDGTWTWKLSADHSYRRWCWSSDPVVNERQPAETVAMHQLLKQEDWPNVKVVLDMHQDNLTQGVPAGAYHYPFGDQTRYTGIIDQIRRLTTILANYDFRFNRDKPEDVVRSDQNGCIVFHDGSLSDLAYRIEVPHALTIETIGTTPIQTAIEVYMTWIRGLCRLIAG